MDSRARNRPAAPSGGRTGATRATDCNCSPSSGPLADFKPPLPGGRSTRALAPIGATGPHWRPSRRPSSRVAESLAVALLIVCLQAGNQGARGSPPVDYFVYTSQLATARAGTQEVGSLLPSLKSIYTPSERANASSQNPSPSPNSGPNNSQRQKLLEEMSARVLNLVANSSHQHDNDLSDLEAARFAWNLMEKQALLYMENRLSALRPFVQELLAEAQVSRACGASIGLWLDELARLKQWATLMWNSWGQFPTAGVFQGSYTDLGSYKSCMAVEENELIGEPQYCMLDFQPVVPARPRFHSIFKRVLAYDSSRRQLTGGDFAWPDADADADADADTRTGSRLSAHEIASSRFSELFAGQAPIKHPKARLSEEERLLLASLASDSELQAPDSGAPSGGGGKHNKRTILKTGRAHLNGSLEEPEQAQQQPGPAIRPLGASRQLNLTLNTEALIELALKAQYFYYVKFRIGSCLPAKCSQADVRSLARLAGQRAILQSVQVNCMKKEPFSLNTYQLVAICILSALALVAILGAVVDLLGYKEEPNSSAALINWLLPFSIWSNARRLFDLRAAGTHSDLGCIHGLRFFSMLWVIYGHTILYMEYQSFTHFYDVIETQIPNFILLPSLNANFSVDTFFVISGILTTYVTWEYTKGEARKFNKFAFMISRYIRLTPQLAIVILCFFLLPLFGDGPMYRQVAEDKAQTCYANWPINLLYLQSYVRADKLCIDPSWWLSIEMSFHVLSALVIIVMIHNVRRGMVVNFVLASALMLWGAAIHYSNGMAIQYLPSIPQRFEVAAEQTKLFFHRPYPHAASYFIGIALGYVLANKTCKKLSRAQLLQGWSLCAFGLVVSLWGSYYWNLGAPYSQLQATLYYNLCQVLWPASIAWIILACSLGHGGFVNAILSARLFVPLGRVTYMTYLSHALIIYYHSARMNITLEPSMLLFTYLFIANTVLALGLGVLLTVLYESPILNLQKQLFAYLTHRFDPTARDSKCRPARLESSSSELHGTPNGCRKANGPGAGPSPFEDTAASILIGEQNALLLANNRHQDAAVAASQNHFQLIKNNQSALNNCLMLDANHDKPQAAAATQASQLKPDGEATKQ